MQDASHVTPERLNLFHGPQLMPRVGIVEDEPYVRRIVETFLSANRFLSHSFRNGQDGLDAIGKGQIDLLLLDLGLPGEDGLAILQSIRRISRIPVIIVSGRKEISSIAAGLDAGADDYVTKPISLEELGARMRSVLRRAQQEKGEKPDAKRYLNLGVARLDLVERKLHGPLGEAPLTEREVLILTLLINAAGQPMSRAMLTRVTLGTSWDFAVRTLDVHVSNIRGKLRKVGVKENLLITARNLGYRLNTGTQGDEK